MNAAGRYVRPVRAVRNTEQGIETVDVPAPEGPGSRVRVAGAGICGSDLHLVSFGPLPMTLGHEIGGITDDGTPVAIWPLVPCGTCDRCLAGQVQQCRTVTSTIYGVARDGGMADEIVVEPSCLVALPPGLAPADAALVEPLACGLHGIRRAGVEAGQRVAVVGAGPIGLSALAAARAAGADVDVLARHDHQRLAGERLGAGVSPKGEYDTVVEAAGTTSAVATALELLRPGGTLLLLASYWDPVTFPAFFTMKEPVLVGSQTHGAGASSRVIDDAAALLGATPDLVDTLLTHRFGLDDAAEAFRVAADRRAGAIKVVLQP
jgi:threonine dehydrogenase-like Zn-dependent dehydrogenase